MFIPEKLVVGRFPQTKWVNPLLLFQDAQSLQRVGQVRGMRIVKRVGISEYFVKLLDNLLFKLVLDFPLWGSRSHGSRLLNRVPSHSQGAPCLAERVFFQLEQGVFVGHFGHLDGLVLGARSQRKIHIFGA